MPLRAPLLRLLRTRAVLEVANGVSNAHPRLLVWHRFGRRTESTAIGIDTFDQQMRIVRERFHPMTASNLCAAIREKRLGRNAVSITIDDGYADFYEYALPILRKYGIPATLYVTTGFINRQLWLWPDYLRFAVLETGRAVYTVQMGSVRRTFDLHSTDGRNAAWNDIADHVLTLRADDAATFIAEVALDLNVQVPAEPTPPYAPLTWDQLREVADAGVEIGGHSCTHPPMTMCSEDRIARELQDCKWELETRLQRPVRSFAYPHALCNATVRGLAASVGYENAISGSADDYVIRDLFDVKRFGSGHDLVSFRNAVYGVRFLASRFGIAT